MVDQSPFSLLVRDDFQISERLKNPRAKGEKDRYPAPEEDPDPFENLLGRQEYSGEFSQEESEESFLMEVDSDEELLEGDTEEEELSFFDENQESKERYKYYREDPSDESDIFPNLNRKDGSDAEIDNLGDDYGWEVEW